MSFALFLDIDGVLNTRTTVVGAPSGRTGIPKLDGNGEYTADQLYDVTIE